MDLLESNSNYIIRYGSKALYCDRLSGSITIRNSDQIFKDWNPVCLGKVDGVLGKLRYYSESYWRLFLIQDSETVGILPDGIEVRRITQVCTVPLTTTLTTADVNLRSCDENHPGITKRPQTDASSASSRKPLMRQVQRHLQNAAGIVDEKLSQHRQRLKYERRIHEELLRLLQTAEESFFYFSPNGDITSWTQKKYSPSYWTGHDLTPQDSTPNVPTAPIIHRQPSWRRADSRFFWNFHLLSDAISDADRFLSSLGFPAFGVGFDPDCNWNHFDTVITDLERLLTPVVQGFIEIKQLSLSEDLLPRDQPTKDSRELNRPSDALPKTSSSVFFLDVAADIPVKKSVDKNVDVVDPEESVDYPASNTTHSSFSSNSLSSLVETPATVVRSDSYTEKKQKEPYPPTDVLVALVSRRSRYRAGTRYRRRGIDDVGEVSNYVETEQILQIQSTSSPQTVAFLQSRGSVPLFWSQTSLKYHPPIIMEKSDAENQLAFSKHWDTMLSNFQQVIIVNLLDCGARRSENLLFESFLRHLLLLNHDQLTCILFDFHDYCRGLHFENASALLSGARNLIQDMKFCWAVDNDLLCEQRSIFRVNCLDCLDRTNLVQCLFAGMVMTLQMKKFGLLGPDDRLPADFMRVIQRIWANNGDAISQQYAGTVAMKGDYTRTGERTVNGLVRDGVSSVNRYYLRFRELVRQAAIDLFLGNEQSPELAMIRDGAGLEAATNQAKEDNVKTLVHRCRHVLLDEDETILSECLLIAYSGLPVEPQFANTILLVTDKNLHFLRIDQPARFRQSVYTRLPVESLQKLELGLEPSVFRSRRHVLRIFYTPPVLPPTKSLVLPATSSTLQSDSEGRGEPILYSLQVPVTKANSFCNQPNARSDSELHTLNPSSLKKSETSQSSSRSVFFQELDGSFQAPRDSGKPTPLPFSQMQGFVRFTGAQSLSKSGTTGTRYLAFIQPNIRLFNTVFMPVPPGDENFQALRVVATVISIAARSVGHELEIDEYVGNTKLTRLRQASVPSSLRPTIDVEKLFADLKPVGLRRMSRRVSRGQSSGNKLSESTETTLASSDGEMFKKTKPATSKDLPSGVDKIKQRLNQIKLPSIRLNIPGRSLNPGQLESTASTSAPSSISSSAPTKQTEPSSSRFFASLSQPVRTDVKSVDRSPLSEQPSAVRKKSGGKPVGPGKLAASTHVTEKDRQENEQTALRDSYSSDEPEEGDSLLEPHDIPSEEGDFLTDSDSEADDEEDMEDSDSGTEEEHKDVEEDEDAELFRIARNRILISCEMGRFIPISDSHPASSFMEIRMPDSDHAEQSDGTKDVTSSNVTIRPSRKRTIHRRASLLTARILATAPFSRRFSKSDSDLSKIKRGTEQRSASSAEHATSDQMVNEALAHDPRLKMLETTVQPASSEHSLINAKTMPAVLLGNLKQTERLRKKQLITAIRLDDLRREICPQQQVRTTFIIF